MRQLKFTVIILFGFFTILSFIILFILGYTNFGGRIMTLFDPTFAKR